MALEKAGGDEDGGNRASVCATGRRLAAGRSKDKRKACWRQRSEKENLGGEGRERKRGVNGEMRGSERGSK